jgi:hypothetical protein
MGGWAVFANLGHPMPKPLIAGAVQGVLSASFEALHEYTEHKTIWVELGGATRDPFKLG